MVIENVHITRWFITIHYLEQQCNIINYHIFLNDIFLVKSHIFSRLFTVVSKLNIETKIIRF